MLSVAAAEAIIVNLVQPLNAAQDIETIDLVTATGRILAAPVTSQLDFPHWDNSAMDGYAVRYADVAGCSSSQPAILEVITEVAAGKVPQKSIQTGQAARIFTGAMMPEGADTIVIQEETQREGNKVKILTAPEYQAFVRAKGDFYQAGQPLLASGTKIGAAEMAVLAAAQCNQIQVYRRPKVAILSTGHELVAPDRPLGIGQIVDSNQYALAAFVTLAGAEPIRLGIIPDDPETLKAAIADALANADMVLSTGGVSVGDYDYVDEILAQLGAEIHMRSVAIKPGKPLTVATFPHGKVMYFGLPGNPASALVTCWRFVSLALKQLSGLDRKYIQSPIIACKTRSDLKGAMQRETYLWGQLHLVNGNFEFELAEGSHNSGNLINLAHTKGVAIVPVGERLIPTGSMVQILLNDLC